MIVDGASAKTESAQLVLAYSPVWKSFVSDGIFFFISIPDSKTMPDDITDQSLLNFKLKSRASSHYR